MQALQKEDALLHFSTLTREYVSKFKEPSKTSLQLREPPTGLHPTMGVLYGPKFGLLSYDHPYS